jgi:uncharacterized cupin superfamily protein
MARRVVTGIDAAGRSVFVSDDGLGDTSASGGWAADVWGSDVTLRLPADGSCPEYETFFPPSSGFRVKMVVLPPEAPLDERREAARRNPRSGPYAVWANDGSGMHTSDTIDVGVILEGEIVLELDDGAETHLHAGDVVVQNGTRHAWHNRTDQPCRMLFAIVGADNPAATSTEDESGGSRS